MPKGVYVKTEEHKRKLSEKLKGRKPWNTDKKLSEEHKRKISRTVLKRKQKLGYINSPEARKKMSELAKVRTGENASNWKGDDVKNVTAIHRRILKLKPKNDRCDICNKVADKKGKTKLELSNIKNHRYTLNPDDYQWVHISCHRKYDKTYLNFKKELM